MWTTPAIMAFAIGNVVFSLGLAGCDSKSENNTAAETTQAKEAPPTANAPAKNPTIKTYIEESGVTETPVRRSRKRWRSAGRGGG